jgi:hypothetical protein
MNQGITIYAISEGCMHEGGHTHKDVFLNKKDAYKYLQEQLNKKKENGRDYIKSPNSELYLDGADFLSLDELELHS